MKQIASAAQAKTVSFIKLLAAAALLFTGLLSCNNSKNGDEKIAKEVMDSNEEKDLTGTFTTGGKELTGKVSTQVFPSTKEFSVLCQANDEKGTLMQITFKDEAAAHTEQDIKIVHNNISGGKGANEADFAFDISNSSKDESGGSAKIVKDGSNYVIEFNNVELFNDGAKMTASGKIPY